VPSFSSTVWEEWRLSRLKFAVVREDSELEAQLVRTIGAQAVLLVASGGCTALALKHGFPELDVVAFDFNPSQLAHVREKAAAVERGELRQLNVGDSSRAGLNQRGDFEGLFRTLRGFLIEFVLAQEALDTFFASGTALEARRSLLARWKSSPYWAAAFAVTFADGFLHAMFGPAATQHATPGSYPGYFQRAFERGLARADGGRNPFLQHVLLGHYRPEDAPAYVYAARALPVTLIEGTLLDVPDLERFDLIHLSNIFDWSDDALVTAWADTLVRKAKPGARILIRQLNNQRPLRRFFEPAFEFSDGLSAGFLERDRSLFYERFEIGTRVNSR
jgi:S-adenosylmethionine-diacylglycerol 3-amino-3-carboxypropyl transferase